MSNVRIAWRGPAPSTGARPTRAFTSSASPPRLSKDCVSYVYCMPYEFCRTQSCTVRRREFTIVPHCTHLGYLYRSERLVVIITRMRLCNVKPIHNNQSCRTST